MIIRKLAQILCALTLFAACLLGQTVSSGLQGTVMDPANAVVPGATVTLTNIDTGNTRVTTTDNTGLFRFLDLAPDTYSVSVKATGFKGYTQNTIAVAANETRDVGKLTLTLGSGTETITVTAKAASIQLASSEKATAIDGGGLFRTGKLDAGGFRRHRDGLRPAPQRERELTDIAGFVGGDGDRVLRVAFESGGLDGHGIGVRCQIEEAEQARVIGGGDAGVARVDVRQRDRSARHDRIGRVHDGTLQSAGNSLSQQAGCDKCQSTENLCQLSDNHQYPLK